MAAVIPIRPPSEQHELFPTIDPGKWQGTRAPARDWMVGGFFVRGTVAMVSGEGKIGKSLLMQQLATCAVTEKLWLGRRVSRGRAVFFACEDDETELQRRQEDINAHYDVEHADLGDAGLVLAPRADARDNVLFRFDRREWRLVTTDLFDRVCIRCRDLGISYLIIDTLSQIFAGNINDATQAVWTVGCLRRLANAMNGVVIIVNHPSMSGFALKTGEAGNRQWNNAVRSRLYMRKDKELGLVLDHKASNYGKSGDIIKLEWRNGVYVVRDEPMMRLPYAAD